MLTLNGAEEKLLNTVLNLSVKGSLAFELKVRLFEEPRSNCCGASTVVVGKTTQHHECTACSGACDTH